MSGVVGDLLGEACGLGVYGDGASVGISDLHIVVGGLRLVGDPVPH